jgi:hypothetical protein
MKPEKINFYEKVTIVILILLGMVCLIKHFQVTVLEMRLFFCIVSALVFHSLIKWIMSSE